MSKHYDSLPENEGILLDLPFREATGIITQDVAKPHHPVTLVNTPAWTQLASLLGVLTFDGLTEYGQCLGADSADLDFTSEDYSVGGWINWTVNETSEIVIARYEVSVSGWEVYLTNSGGVNFLSLRHHHAAGATLRTGAFSTGWTPSNNFFFGISRSGNSAQFYRNGIAVATTSDVLIDPETSARDLVIGIRFTKDANRFQGNLYRPRVWDRALSADDWLRIYIREAGYFA